MVGLHFEWNGKKAAANLRKHKVSFREAQSVFFDESARMIDDPDHSESEQRFILLGFSFALRILVVHHTYRPRTGAIRLISARKATRTERAYYRRQGRS